MENLKNDLIKNLKTAIAEKETLQKVHDDFAETFQRLGFLDMSGHGLAASVLLIIRGVYSIEEAETEINLLKKNERDQFLPVWRSLWSYYLVGVKHVKK